MLDQLIITPKAIGRRAKLLRQRETQAEKVLWQSLRAKRFNRWKFRRQVPVGPFIADFMCVQVMLIIEVDGGIHEIQRERDLQRECFLQRYGFRFVRFRNEHILQGMHDVLRQIAVELERPLPDLLPKREVFMST